MNILLAGSSDELIGQLRNASLKPAVIPTARLSEFTNAPGFKPDVLIADVRGTMRLPAGLPAFRRHFPACGIVLIATSLDPSLMLEAMRAGVNECVAEPFEHSDVLQAIGRVTTQRAAGPEAELIAFIGAKGGVGTTTVAVNVATVLASLSESPTLLLDLDLAHGDASVFLGCEPRFSVWDALTNLERLDETFLKSLVHQAKGGLHFLGPPDRIVTASIEPRGVSRLVECAARQYRYVVLDLPRSDRRILDALDSLSKIVVIANQELASVRSATRMASAFREKFGANRVLVVLTRYDQNAEIRQDDVERLTGVPVRYVLPNGYRQALDALNRGRPLVLENHNRLSGALDACARGLAGLTTGAPERSSGILGLLTGRR